MHKVITTKGIIPVSDLHIGDMVYEYGTSNPIEVKNIIDTECCSSVEVTFSDGRHETYGCCEYVPTGVLVKANELPENGVNGTFFLYETEFNKGRITEPLYPDPYVTGAFLIYGDYSTPYLNLPLRRYEANNNISHKYNIEYFPTITSEHYFFQWKGKNTDHRITWEEFFPKYDFYAKNKCIYSTPIPLEYMFARKADRVQFIRGAFDIGYHKDLNPDQVAINHWSKERLEWLQWMIWSMGIPCTIDEYPEYNDDRYRYQLTVLGDANRYPGFFYWGYLEHQIKQNYEHPMLEKREHFTIVHTEKIDGLYRMFQPVFEKPTIYYSSQFLPRCSYIQ